MDQEPIDHSFELDDSPSTVRAAMAETRQQLALHLSALKERLLHPLEAVDSAKDPTMPTAKKSSRQPADKKSQDDKSPSSRADAKTKKKSAPSASVGASQKTTAAKSEKSSKSEGTKTRKTAQSGKAAPARKKTSAREGKAQSLVARTGETLDTMVAGAIVGAVTGAARNLAHEPTAMPLCDEPPSGQQAAADVEKPTTGQVLEEMASGAAIGAVSGSAKAVMTTAQDSKNPKRPKKQKH